MGHRPSCTGGDAGAPQTLLWSQVEAGPQPDRPALRGFEDSPARDAWPPGGIATQVVWHPGLPIHPLPGRTGSRKRAQISAPGQLLAAECSPETSGLVASSTRPAAGSPPWPRLAPSVLAPVSCPGPGPFLGSPAPGRRAGCSEPRRNCISWAHPDPGVPSYWASLLLRPPSGAERRPPGQARRRSASGAETQVPCPVARGAHRSGFQTRLSLWVAGPSHDRRPSAAPSRDGCPGAQRTEAIASRSAPPPAPPPAPQTPSVRGRQQTVRGSPSVLALHNTVPCFPTNTPSGPRLMATWWCPGGGGRRERKAPKELALGSQQPAAPSAAPHPASSLPSGLVHPPPPTPPVGARPGAGAGAGAEPDPEAREHRDGALRGSPGGTWPPASALARPAQPQLPTGKQAGRRRASLGRTGRMGTRGTQRLTGWDRRLWNRAAWV